MYRSTTGHRRTYWSWSWHSLYVYGYFKCTLVEKQVSEIHILIAKYFGVKMNVLNAMISLECSWALQ